MHVARLAKGSHRRYCCVCKSRWKSPVKAYSTWANLFVVGPIFALLGFLTYQVWLDTRYDMDLADGWDARTGTAAGRNPDGSMAGSQDGSAAGAYGRGLRANGQYWRTGQMMNADTMSLGGLQGGGRKNGQFQDMLWILQQLLSFGKTPQQIAREIDHTDKQTLWNKYGSNFASKEDAKAAYEDFQRHRNEITK